MVAILSCPTHYNAHSCLLLFIHWRYLIIYDQLLHYIMVQAIGLSIHTGVCPSAHLCIWWHFLWTIPQEALAIVCACWNHLDPNEVQCSCCLPGGMHMHIHQESLLSLSTSWQVLESCNIPNDLGKPIRNFIYWCCGDGILCPLLCCFLPTNVCALHGLRDSYSFQDPSIRISAVDDGHKWKIV